MKLFSKSALVLGFLAAASAVAADYDVDKSHSKVTFEVPHMMVSTVTGEFRDFNGKFSFDETKPETSMVEFTVKTASVDTNERKRDEHLKSAEFFDATKYPKLTFVSKKVTKEGSKKYNIEGDLTIHGVTKPVTFETTYNGTTQDPWGMTRTGFKATTTVDRKDFGLTWNKTLDKGGVAVGDQVEITMKIEGIMKQDNAKKAKK